MKNILIIRYKGLGDVILILPLIEAIKKAHPDWKIDILTWSKYKEVFLNLSYINKVFVINEHDSFFNWIRMVYKIRKQKYDITLFLHSSYQGVLSTGIVWLSGAKQRFGPKHFGHRILYTYSTYSRTLDQHFVESKLKMIAPLNITDIGKGSINLTKDEIENGKRILNKINSRNRGYVCLVPGARLEYKMWPCQNFSRLAEKLYESGFSPIFVGHKKDEKYVRMAWNKFPTAGCIISDSLRDISSIFSSSDLVIANDTGLKHLAAASGAHVIALHGHSDPKVWGPWGEGHEVITSDIACRPCNNINLCRFGSSECLTKITPEEVFEKIEKLVG